MIVGGARVIGATEASESKEKKNKWILSNRKKKIVSEFSEKKKYYPKLGPRKKNRARIGKVERKRAAYIYISVCSKNKCT